MTAVEPARRGARRKPTATSAFGVGRRESHDASGFYARFTPPLVSDDDTVNPPAAIDTVWAGDATDMDASGAVAPNSVALVVTSPPYFAGKEYEAALGVGHIPADYEQYLEMLHAVFAECRDRLEPGGRIAVNVANLGRKPYRSLSADVIAVLESLGLLLRGEIIWQKSRAASGSCAWGTYQRPGNPVLRDVTERIVVASKGRFDRAVPAEARAAQGLPSEGSITMDEFVDATTDLWDFPSESATRVGHPAPFPVELPRRLIELYTYRGDLVLDPFMGSGSTAVAAVLTDRHYVGFDTDPGYVALAERRVAEARAARTADGTGAGGLPVRVAVAPGKRDRTDGTADVDVEGDGPDHDLVATGAAAGQKARELAAGALLAAGFTHLETGPVLTDLGVDVTFRARDALGATWLFDLAGAWSTTRPGLKRADVLWRTLGRASVLHQARLAEPNRTDLGPLVLLSTDTPGARTPTGRALRAVTGTDGSAPVHAVVGLLDPAGTARLGELARGGSAGG